ncbi:MAG: hypothetical protein U0610_33085 [bacterium]
MSLIGGIRAGPSRRLFAYFLPLDLVFKVLTFVPFVAGLRIAAAGERASVYAFLAILAGVGLAVWMAWAVRYLRPVDRWERQHLEDASSAEALARAAKAIAWAPSNIADALVRSSPRAFVSRTARSPIERRILARMVHARASAAV